jgi:penicillin amidase
MITDLSDVSHSLSINSTGQSGQPFHPNYDDQVRLWLYGDYKESLMNENEMIPDRYSLLLLIP